MLRRLVIAGLAAVLAAPLWSVPHASAVVLFTCPGLDTPARDNPFVLHPGLNNTPRLQNMVLNRLSLYDDPCSNGERLVIQFGDQSGVVTNSTLSYPSRPMACPASWGGSDYPDGTPLLIGASDPSFQVTWYSDDTTSTGVVKIKAGPVGSQLRLVFTITNGKYVAPAGTKTKIQLRVTIEPAYDNLGRCDDAGIDSFQQLSANQAVVMRK
jgi:hypothetical protein